MLILATFISVCMAAVFFLLRFLFALQSEISSAPKRSAACVHHISYRIPSGDWAHGPAPALALIHSNSGMALRGFPVSFDSRARNSQLKKA